MSFALKYFSLFFVAGVTGLIAYQIWGPLSSWWDRYMTKWSRWMQLELEAQYRKKTQAWCRQQLVRTVAGMAVLGFLLRPGVLFPLVFGGLGLLVPRWVIAYLRNRRFSQINDQLVDGLTLISNALRSGLSLPQALELLVKEMKPPISDEFGVVLKEHKLGLLLDESLLNLTKRVPVDDLDMMVTSVTTIRETGGNLTEVFDVIARTITERKKVEGKIKAMTAQGMMQGFMMCAIPPVLGLAFYLLDPNYMLPMLTSVMGILMLLVMVAMDLMGMWMMLSIVKIDV
jgi:tight adherence protein B